MNINTLLSVDVSGGACYEDLLVIAESAETYEKWTVTNSEIVSSALCLHLYLM